MAVNDIELAVGQVWRTRGGLQATIVSVGGSGHSSYPVIASVEKSGQKSYDLDGRFSKTAETENDLVHYVCNDGNASDGWIKWSGGDCPVAGYQPVQAKLRSGRLAFNKHAVYAGDLSWGHTYTSGDIVEYMVLPLSTPAESQKLATESANDGGHFASLRMDVKGYERLADVLHRAYDQAARGKGAERHANNKPFHEQPMVAICRNLGSIDGMLYQASKKAMESRGLPTRERALAEIYGAINYLCGAAILIEEGIIKGQE